MCLFIVLLKNDLNSLLGGQDDTRGEFLHFQYFPSFRQTQMVPDPPHAVSKALAHYHPQSSHAQRPICQQSLELLDHSFQSLSQQDFAAHELTLLRIPALNELFVPLLQSTNHEEKENVINHVENQ